MIISATVRNDETLHEFVGRCRMRKLVIQDIAFQRARADITTGPFYSDDIPIRIMRITSEEPLA